MMFDVSWHDPMHETVGQRKHRKEKHGQGVSRGSSVRSSESGNSKGSKTSDSGKARTSQSLLGFFGKNKDKPVLKLSPLKIDGGLPTRMMIGNDSTISASPPKLVTAEVSPIEFPGDGFHKRGNSESNSDESILSGWTAQSANTNSTWSSGTAPSLTGRIIQPLSPTSYVTQSTEITISSRDSFDAAEQLATVVHISAAGSLPVHVQNLASKMPSMTETLDPPVLKSRLVQKKSSQVLRDDVELSSDGWLVTPRTRSSDTWKPPDAWDCTSEALSLAGVQDPLGKPQRRASRRFKDGRRVSGLPVDLVQLRRRIRRMESASPRTVLERLREQWAEVADASDYREMELAKQLWMLTALRRLSKRREVLERVAMPSYDTATLPTKVLSLYENQASASLLSALSPHPEVHHLATSPLSSKSYPNVRPLSIPSPMAQLPYASNIFTSIHAISMPSLFLSQSVPTLLKECQRILIAGGRLHLTLLDPSPVPSTLGPRLQTYLDTHLLINLERQFRCIHPNRLFPIWLADAGLRAHGSTIATIKFQAAISKDASSESTHTGSEGDGSGDGELEDAVKRSQEVKQQLKSQIGRMLWKEMWAAFVEGDKWWWDDELIVEECEHLGTRWDYSVIEAVKEG